MVDQIIRPADLPNRANPVASEKVPVDNGVSVGGATIQSIVESGRPAASQSEAEAGVNSVKAMTPLTTDQKIEYEIGRSLASKAQGDKADSAIQEIVEGANTTVDNTDPQRPIISSSGAPSAGFKSDIVVVDSQDNWRISRNYKTVADLLADNGSGNMGMGYAGSGANVIVSPGDIITAQGFRYEVAASGATDAHVETSGGVKLYALELASGGFTTEQFGCVGDGVADDTDPLFRAVHAINPFSPSYATMNEVRALNEVPQKRLHIVGLVRYRSTLHVPAGLALESGPLYFSRDTKGGLFFDPVDLNSTAIAALIYKRNVDDSYSVYDSCDSLAEVPKGYEIDDGTYAPASYNSSLKCSLVTATGVRLGVYWAGAAGTSTDGLSVGSLGGDRYPDVAVLFSGCWGSLHTKLHTISRVQGVVTVDANAGMVIDAPYINRFWITDNELDTPVFMEGYEKAGAVGITSIGTVGWTLRNPVIEHWYTHGAFVSGSSVTVDTPHNESRSDKALHTWAVVDSSLYLDNPGYMVADASDPDSSSIWIQDCDVDRVVHVEGYMLATSAPLVTGEDSSAVLTVRDLNYNQVRYGKLGDSSLVNELGYSGRNYVSVSQSGDDENFGFHFSSPVQTLGEAIKRIAAMGGSGEIELSGNIYQTTPVDMTGVRDVSLYLAGHFLDLDGVDIRLAEPMTNIRILGGAVRANVSIFRQNAVGDARISFSDTALLAYGGVSPYAVVNFVYPGRASILSSGSNLNVLSTYATGPAYSELSIFVKGANRNTALDTNPADANTVVSAKDFRN